MKVIFQPNITVSMSASEWMLLDGPELERVAEVLSVAAANALMEAWKQIGGPEAMSPIQACYFALDEWRKTATLFAQGYGACDTEPRSMMQDLAWRLFADMPETTIEFLRAAQ
ncbi:hypothetical protein DF134_35595 [Burkholderia stagnalis]|uniref:hypothetical protein n=1 Tax=Burkholderia stagnalis TaxID=1503054 RepID=UPI000F5B02F0|nr:hypothetical protein [Burkholderia stagnalis]RQQ78688.1 hypothetical protein DF134_35595 [Burkholderia stagnalis]